ncbi:putative General secretion pathway protein H [Candidatus Zixiibacteriota bacterium]|nr:putative General secretion pathway protein H [candidate division Zixibacteria bacterium]
MTKFMRPKSGFTLVELMAVVVVIGIASAVASPIFNRAIQRIRFRGETKDVLSTLRTARSYALSQKDPFGVYFDGNNHTVTLFKDMVNPGTNVYETGDSVLRIDTLPRDIVYLYVTMLNSCLVYSPNGTASESGYVYLMSDNNSVVNISQLHVLASTGRSKINYIHNY